MKQKKRLEHPPTLLNFGFLNSITAITIKMGEVLVYLLIQQQPTKTTKKGATAVALLISVVWCIPTV